MVMNMLGLLSMILHGFDGEELSLYIIESWIDVLMVMNMLGLLSMILHGFDGEEVSLYIIESWIVCVPLTLGFIVLSYWWRKVNS